MRKVLISAVLAGLALAVQADPTMKPGLWEVRTTKQLMDGQDMTAQIAAAQAQMQEMMGKMSPAQRKQMEQAMGKPAASAGQNSQRICISPEMAARDKPMLPPDARCEPTKLERSGNKTSFEINCASEGRNMRGKGESIASGDTISSKMDMVMTDASGRHTMQSESQMKFIGSDCQGLKPVDQMVREMSAAKKK